MLPNTAINQCIREWCPCLAPKQQLICSSCCKEGWVIMEANISISAGDSCRLSAPSSHSLKSHTGSGSSFLTPLALWYRKYMWLIQLLWVALRAPPPEATGCLCSRYVFIICHACKTEVSTPILAPFSEPSSGSPSPSYPMEYASYYFNACNWVCKPHSQLQSY